MAYMAILSPPGAHLVHAGLQYATRLPESGHANINCVSSTCKLASRWRLLSCWAMQVRVVEGGFGSTARRVARGDRLAPGAQILVPNSFLPAPPALPPGETVHGLGWAETASTCLADARFPAVHQRHCEACSGQRITTRQYHKERNDSGTLRPQAAEQEDFSCSCTALMMVQQCK